MNPLAYRSLLALTALFHAQLIFAAPTTFISTVSFDPFYDNAQESLEKVACSSGSSGFLSNRAFTTLGSLPVFPFVGAAPAISGVDSDECGSCWLITYEGRSIAILAIDSASGFKVGFEAFDALTNGRGGEVVDIQNADVKRLKPSSCGL